MEVRLDDGRGDTDPDRHGPFFPWSRLGRTALRARAEAEGWTVAEEWDARGRFFLALRPGRDARTVRGAAEAERRIRGRGRGGDGGHGVTSR